MPSKMTASQRRRILANAHAAWFCTVDKDAAKRALQEVLAECNYIDSTDQITVRLDGTTIQILVDADEFQEVIELDTYGSMLRGAE